MKSNHPSPLGRILALIVWAALAVSPTWLNSCAPKPVVIAPIAPAAAQLKAATDATTTTAKHVQATVTDIATKATDLHATLAQGMLDAERVRKSGLADQTFLDSNAQHWQAATLKIGLLEAMTQSATIDSAELSASATVASAQAGEMVKSSAQVDAGVQTLKTQIVAQADDAAVGKLLKRSVWIAFVCAVIALLLFLFVKFSPAIIQAFKPL